MNSLDGYENHLEPVFFACFISTLFVDATRRKKQTDGEMYITKKVKIKYLKYTRTSLPIVSADVRARGKALFSVF